MTTSQHNHIFLDRNENLYGPSPKCFEALRAMTLEELSFYSRDFQRGVKSTLSERLAQEHGIAESQILLSEGSEDMLKQAVHCYLGPGEKILCPDQSWWYYRAVAAEVGGETVTYKLHERGNAYVYDVDALIDQYERISPRVVLIASPNNPTGNSFRDDDLLRLTEAFRESIVILDEAYWGFSSPDAGRLGRLVGSYRNLLVLRTFSKFYALAGARIGYAAAGASLSRLTRFASRYLGYNRISELLALAALDSPEYYRAINENIRADRDRLYAFFDGIRGATCFRSDANFVLVRLPAGLAQGLADHLKTRDILVKTFSEDEFRDCIRITIGTREHTRTLEDALAGYFSSSPQTT
ncbi:MAG: histidinol-phosphate aminotransferase family protein, partial [Ignavibacterium sp.]|jgi:histidinol-phosphate aminotransferase